MRRKDREVTANEKIKAIILSCSCCRLGFYDAASKEVYLVPLNFGYEEKEGKRFFYFHGAKSGRKLDLISQNSSVGFELDTHHELIEGDTACKYSARFQSVVGTGRVSLLENPEEKRAALQTIMFHHTGKRDWEFPDAAVQATSVFYLEVEKLSCKEHL